MGLPIASCVATTSTTTTIPTTPTTPTRTTTPTTSTQKVGARSSDDDSNSTAVIMGIVIGILVLFSAIVGSLWWKQRYTSSATVGEGVNTLEMRRVVSGQAGVVADWSSSDYTTNNNLRSSASGGAAYMDIDWSSDYTTTDNLRRGAIVEARV